MKRFINCLWPRTLKTSLTYKPFQYLMMCIYMQASGVTVMYDTGCAVLSFNVLRSCFGAHMLVSSYFNSVCLKC